jgi:diaminopimelate decarboxylase
VAVPEATAALKSSAPRDIVEAHGSPVYVLDLERLDRNYDAFVGAWTRAGRAVSVFYSVKTNYLPIVCRRMRLHGAGADVVSGHEIEVALAAGFTGEQLVLNGPMKTVGEIERLVALGGAVNVDALDDIVILEEQAQRLGHRLDVGLRINPSLSPYTSLDPSFTERAARAARRSKFGWPIHTGAADRVARRIVESRHLRLTGLHCQLGSQVTDTESFLAAIEGMLRFAAAAPWRASLRSINVGGGFGVPGIERSRTGPIGELLRERGAEGLLGQAQAFDLDRFIAGLFEALERHGLGDLEIACEPGRVIVSDAISLLTTVVSVKDIGEGTWVILDGGINLLPTAGVGERHRMEVVDREHAQQVDFMVAGPLCYDQDVYSYSQSLAEDLAPGDLVEIHDAGAYSITRATNFIRGRAPVVATLGGASELCWERESSEDIFAPAVYTRFEAEAEGEP